MAGQAYSAFGTLLKMSDMAASTPAFTTIAEVTDISGPSMSTNVIDAMSHSSTGGFKDKIAGMIDPGEVTFTVNFVPGAATHDAASASLLAYLQSRQLVDFKLVFPLRPGDTGTNKVWGFKAYVTSFEAAMPMEDVLSADITLTISGSPTFTGVTP